MKIWLLTLVAVLLIGGPASAQELKRISLDDGSGLARVYRLFEATI